MFTRRTRGYLPHLELSHGTYFVTFRLADSLPVELMLRWQEELRFKKIREINNPKALTQLENEFHRKIENYLDKNQGKCWLKDAEIGGMVAKALRFFNGQRYTLHAWTIMPNHVHVLLSELAPYKLGSIVHSWKSFTAHQAMRLLGQSGQFWQREYYENLIRSGRQFEFVLRYILNNPVKAGLCKDVYHWPLSGFEEEVQGLVERFFWGKVEEEVEG